MTKKEQAEMEAIKTVLALRCFPEVKPDVIATSCTEIVTGYTFNSYNKRVEKACSTSKAHGYEWEKTSCQGARDLFSTEELAYGAMLHELSVRFAMELREVEIRKEAASQLLGTRLCHV